MPRSSRGTLFMRRLVLLVVFVLTVFSYMPSTKAQSFPLWGSLEPGAHPVGYRATIVPDRSRTFIPGRNYEGKLYAGERSRLLLIQIFYPARLPSNAARMVYGDYLNLKGDTGAAARVAEGLRQRAQA